MATEHKDVSPASAGGASASKLCFAPVGQNGRGLAIRCDLPWGHPGAHHGVAGIDYGLTVRTAIPEPFRRMFWVAAEDIANVIGCTVVEGEPRGYDETEPRDTDPGKLREIANALHALLGEEDCTERAVTHGHLWYLVRLVAGHLDAISDRNRPRPGLKQLDPRDAEIERLRVQFDGIRGALRAANILIEGTRSERDQARAEVEELEQISFTAYAELLNPIKKVFGESPVAASHYRELREGIDGLIGKIEHWQGLAETRGAQVEEFARAIRELTNERDRLRGELDGQRADKEQAEAAHDRLRTRLDQHLADENSAQAANDRLRAALANAEAYRDIAQANERDLRRRLKRIAQETSFESALPDTDGEVPF